MRLTLRTLLAYLDDILEPAEAREIGQKINESVFASTLVGRIREVMRRRRLTAPALSGAASGIDPNTVAEYIDNTLRPEAVVEVERICLESDVHLAELAACHQILTLVLGEPVDIPPASRERMYALTSAAPVNLPMDGLAASDAPANGASSAAIGESVNRTLSKAASTASTSVAAMAAPAASNAMRPVETSSAPAPASFHSGLPEELRPKRQWRTILQYGALAVVLLGWVGLAWFDSPFNSGPDAAATPRNKKPADRDDVAANNSGKDHLDLDDNPVEGQLTDENSANDTDTKIDIEPGKSTNSGASKPDVTGEVASIDSPAPEDLPERAGDGTAAKNASVAAPDLKTDEEDQSTKVAVGDTSKSEQEMPTKGSDGKQPVADTPPEKTPTEVAAVTPNIKPESAPETPKKSPTVRRNTPAVYVSQTGILLYENEEDAGRWHMRPRSSELESDLALAVPEPFEAVLQIDGKRGTARLGPGTRIKTIESNEVGFGLDVHRGTVVFQSTPAVKEDSPLLVGIRLREEFWILEIGPNTTVGVFVAPKGASKFQQGFGDNWYEGTLVLKSGRVVVRSASGETTPMRGSGFWVMTPEFRATLPDKTPLLVSTNKLPQWIEGKPLPRAAQLMAQRFEKAFSLGSAVELMLGDVAKTDNSTEARLKVRCLGLVSAIEPLLEVLSNTKQHDESRQAAIDEIRMWLPSDPANGDKLSKQLNVQFPPETAKDYYRLLWGFDEADLGTISVTKDLLNWMESDDVSIRELAYQNVRRYSPKEFEYRASKPLSERKTAMQGWRRYVRENGDMLIPPGKKTAKEPRGT